ncbi:hypothetical protein FHETE_1040 [Fusarium heterosporum]|uniref:Uncharacterized protein n=1 Tax=Fusarium heterosporum TaxID=42747 RepID=A0A8H5X0K5_FUSHE|nr:hypothetical protein FHETE_1040 [Fusarium heterosporum]
MSIRRDAVYRDFGLRPSIRSMLRSQVPIEQPVESEPSPFEAEFTKQSTDLPGKDAPEDDGSSTISPTGIYKDIPQDIEKPAKRRHSEESESSEELPLLPPHFPPCPMNRPNHRGIVVWRDACHAVQDAQGNINPFDVVTYLLTKKGGLANPGPLLPEDDQTLENMRKGIIDPAKIWRRQQEEEEIARAKEERRQANKRRYRRRGQVDKERAERRAALAPKQAQDMVEQGSTTTGLEKDASGTKGLGEKNTE